MQLVRWPNDLDLGTKSTSLCVADGGLLRRDHAGVRYHRGIGRFQNPAVAFDERGQVGTADFLLPFEDAEEVHGQGMAGRDIGFDGLQMRKELPLVVGRATTIENIVFDCRRERRCSPIAERLSWQYVVVTVDDKCWPSWSTAPRGNDDGMARGSVFVPFCYYEAAANMLTNPVLDPFGKIPEFKYCAVKITKGGVPPERLSFGGGVLLPERQPVPLR